MTRNNRHHFSVSTFTYRYHTLTSQGLSGNNPQHRHAARDKPRYT